MATQRLVRFDEIPPILVDLGYDPRCVTLVEPEPGDDLWVVEHFARHRSHSGEDELVVVFVRELSDPEEEVSRALPIWRQDVVFVLCKGVLADGEAERWYFVEPIPLERDEFSDEFVPQEVGIGY